MRNCREGNEGRPDGPCKERMGSVESALCGEGNAFESGVTLLDFGGESPARVERIDLAVESEEPCDSEASTPKTTMKKRQIKKKGARLQAGPAPRVKLSRFLRSCPTVSCRHRRGLRPVPMCSAIRRSHTAHRMRLKSTRLRMITHCRKCSSSKSLVFRRRTRRRGLRFELRFREMPTRRRTWAPPSIGLPSRRYAPITRVLPSSALASRTSMRSLAIAGFLTCSAFASPKRLRDGLKAMLQHAS